MVAPTRQLRVLVDANVLLAGSAFPRWPYEVLRHALRGDFQLVLCPLIIEEARKHLETRFPHHLARFDEFLDESDYELVNDPSPAEVLANRTLVRDLSDVPVALAAMSAGADVLVSTDKDLTVEDATTVELRRLVTVQLPGTFLRETMGWTSEQLEAIRHRTWSELALASASAAEQ